MVYFIHMLKMSQNQPLGKFTTFGLDATARYFCVVKNIDELIEALKWSKVTDVTSMILGGGSNVIFNDEKPLDMLVIKMEIDGYTLGSIKEKDDVILVQAMAGMNWDEFVAMCVNEGFTGVEALSAIPGSVGATPVQNVGAYGVEVGDVIQSVEVLDRETLQTKTLTRDECQFSYRDSIFKHPEGKKYIIISVTFRLYKNVLPEVPSYPGVALYFEKEGIHNPTVGDIRKAITTIRWSKLPDPKVLASCGSFFKNPIVKNSIAQTLKEQYPTAVVHDVGGGFSKIGAGWLIDTLGLKGQTFGKLSVYDKNALVIANLGGATKKELDVLVADIQTQAREKFGINLEPEPIFVE